MKYILALLIFLTSQLQAESKPWTNTIIDPANLSPVDELVMGQFKPTDKVHKLSHPDVTTVKIYLGTENSKVVYAVWKFKPLPSGWQIYDATDWNPETKFAKGIPADFLDYLHLQGRPSVDYSEKYKRPLPKVKKFRSKMVQSNAKGCVEFNHDDFSGEPNRDAIKQFYMEHRVTFVIPIVYGDSSRTDIILCYDDGSAPVQQKVLYEVENK